jgi:exodeoxyribonuclease VII small subunit
MNMNISYEKAQEELQAIVKDLQEEHVNIDELSKKVKRAAELVEYCKEKLRTTEEAIGGLFE